MGFASAVRYSGVRFGVGVSPASGSRMNPPLSHRSAFAGAPSSPDASSALAQLVVVVSALGCFHHPDLFLGRECVHVGTSVPLRELITQPSSVRPEAREPSHTGIEHSGEPDILCNQQVAGSNPAASSIPMHRKVSWRRVAQFPSRVRLPLAWDLPDTHRRVLEQLRDGDSDDIDSTVLDELRRWG